METPTAINATLSVALDASQTAADALLTVALEDNANGTPSSYPAHDLSASRNCIELALGIQSHIERCARLIGQDQSEVLITFWRDDLASEDESLRDALVICWEAGPINWPHSKTPLGIRMPDWALANVGKYSFVLAIRDAREVQE